MDPVGKIELHKDGNLEKRIGHNKRHDLPGLKDLETIIDQETPLAVTCDVKTIQPPYFTEFKYLDILGGVLLGTLSAEINYRVRAASLNDNVDSVFPIGSVMDKYQLTPTQKTYRKIIFLPGSNSLNLIDQFLLQRLLEDDEWMIKPHPVTNQEMLRDIGSLYGYHRILDTKISGIQLLEGCAEIATCSTSELYLLARLLGKPVSNITRYDNSWLTAYGEMVHYLDNTDDDIRKITNMLLSPLSGYLRPDYTENHNRTLVRNYAALAMDERAKFKHVTTQRLIVSDRTLKNWH